MSLNVKIYIHTVCETSNKLLVCKLLFLATFQVAAISKKAAVAAISKRQLQVFVFVVKSTSMENAACIKSFPYVCKAQKVVYTDV
jgi:hypothetical protein